MAHIPDGILSAPVLIGGTAVAVAGVALALRHLDDRAILRTAILSATFFTVSLVSVPLGPTSVHLLLGGVMGIMLGWGAALAVLVGLTLQAVMFGIGGITTLGVNTMDIAGPGVILGLWLGPAIRRAASPAKRGVLAALAGGGSVLGTGLLVSLVLTLTSRQYAPVAGVVAATYIPLALVEAAITVAVVGFLAKTDPSALSPVRPAPAAPGLPETSRPDQTGTGS